VKTDLVRFGVDPPAPNGGDWRERLDIPRDAFVVLSTRLFKSNYNIHVIIEAMPLLLRDVPATVLVLKEYEPFSDPSYRARCLDLIDHLGIGPAVRLVGELPAAELRELYAASDVYVSVPSTDGTAVSVFEAMASRVPVVASRAEGIDPEVLRDGYSTRLVDPGRSDDLSRVLIALARDADARGALVESAYAVYELLGSASSEFDRAERIYRELLTRLGRSA
jgi:glycosyltransferase involved in cell wall biosynthesis